MVSIKITMHYQGLEAEVWNEEDEWFYDVVRTSDGYCFGGNTEGFDSKEIAREEARITMEDIINNPSEYFD